MNNDLSCISPDREEDDDLSREADLTLAGYTFSSSDDNTTDYYHYQAEQQPSLLTCYKMRIRGVRELRLKHCAFEALAFFTCKSQM